jgi:TLD
MSRKRLRKVVDRVKKWSMFVGRIEVAVKMDTVVEGKLEVGLGRNRRKGMHTSWVLVSSWRRRVGMSSLMVGKPLRQLCWTLNLPIWLVYSYSSFAEHHSSYVSSSQLRPHLPALARLPRKWTLLYSLDQHGISLNTLYTLCEFPPPRLDAPIQRGALVVLKDAGDALFGVWMGEEGLHPSRGKGYYGSGECFMWNYVGGKFQVFKWTGRNNYVALCEPEYISFGGG